MTGILAKTTQIMSRRCSAFLTLFIAAFRAFSVTFPMSNAVDFLSEPKNGYRIVVITMGVCACWSSLYYFTTIFIKLTQCPIGTTPSWVMYQHDTTGEVERKLRTIDGAMAVVVILLYFFVTMLLIIALARAKQKRKNLKNEQGNDATKLIILMAFFTCISEASYGALFLTSYFVFEGYEEQ
ncbi:unnamed protein product [Caenorhabditis brenneri]